MSTILVLLPAILAFVPAFLPRAISAKALSVTALLIAIATLGSSVVALLSPLSWAVSGPELWRNDGLARALALLPAIGWVLVALRTAQPGERVRPAITRWHRWPVLGQATVAASIVAIRADLLAILPVSLGGLIVLAMLADGGTVRGRVGWLTAIPVMMAGVAILSAATGAPACWHAMPAIGASARVSDLGFTLLLTPILLLSAALFLRPVLANRFAPLRGLSRICLLVPTGAIALRCAFAVPIGAELIWFGVGWMLLSLLLAPSCRALDQRVSLLASVQAGAVIVGIGVGGPGGVAASLMVAAFLAFLLPIAQSFPADPWSARVRTASVIVLLGLPPFGPFAAGMVLLIRLAGGHLILAVILLAAFALSALAALDALRREATISAVPRPGAWALAGGVSLAASLWLGVAMPISLSDWLLAVAGSRP